VTLIRSVLFALVFYLGCIVFVGLAGLSVPFGTKAIVGASRRWALWHRFCARHILGLRAEFDRPLPVGVYIYAFKHESMFETIETLAWFNHPAVVFKRELLDIPVWGWVARAHGVIPVDRDSGSAAVRLMLKAGKQAIAEGRAIVIFPEGTRVPHGQSPQLGAGLAGMYRMLGLPIVPIALDSGLYSPKRSFLKRSGIIRMKVGEIIPTGLSREEVEARVHSAINALNG
jgi:1-acyl-sn-glycerol-3-phosphate acyltransferase